MGVKDGYVQAIKISKKFLGTLEVVTVLLNVFLFKLLAIYNNNNNNNSNNNNNNNSSIIISWIIIMMENNSFDGCS